MSVQYSTNWSTHIPTLVKVMALSEGPVLEIGSGLFSTPLLYWLCYDQGREFETYDNSQYFVDTLKGFGVQKIDDWDKLPIEDKRWGIIFIDQHPSIRRGVDAIRAAQYADYTILHDTNDDAGHGYDEAYKHYKYRSDWKKQKAYTTVLSNFKELNL